MRFGPEFDNLPDTVPKALYNVVDKKKDSMKKTREKLDLKPTQEQQILVRRFAQFMPPDFFFDSVIFPMDEKLARGLADMTESVGEVIGYPFTSDGYSCYFDGNQFSLLDKYARSLISGSIGDLYSYMKSYAPLAYNAIRNAAVRHEFPEFKITPESIKDVQNLLSEFRKQRSFNKTMDVVSKIKPIALIDQDSTISKFTITPDMPVHDNCLHVGSGSNTSSSIRAVLGHYSRIVCVDPLTTPGPNHIKSTFDISKVKKDFDVISDLAYGDGEGMIVGESIKHARELYTICHDRLVVVKLPAVIGYGQIFGHVLFKPRPHNLEVIVQLTPYGDLLDEAFKPVIEKIIKANHERNICVFKNNLDMDIKPTFHTPLELRDLMLSRHQLPNPGNARNLAKIDRNKNMVVQGGYVKIGQRHKELKMRCTNPGYRFDGPYGQLPAYNIMRGKTFMELDPGLCDVDLSMRTVYRSAQSCGLSVVFVRGIWSVV